MDVQEVLSRSLGAMTVKRVFGEPFEKDGLTFVPVARIGGGGGGGGGEGEEPGKGKGGGFGLGLGLGVEPAGAYVIKDGTVRWQPAVDPTRIILRLGGLALIAIVQIARARAKKR
jgi:uncharacterized spore protein YtfJ